MRQLVLLLFITVVSFSGFAQVKNPVKWTFSSKKTGGGNYEIHLTAILEGKWHIYSQSTPDGGPVPTSIQFNKNPLVIIKGQVKEIGKLQQKNEPLFGVDVKQYSNKVDFVQTIQLESNVKTNLAGTIEYMVCDDTQCLPPSTQKFSIALQ